MTSPVAVSSAPRRRATTAPLRRLSRTVLFIGTVVALLAASGPLWMVRIGLVVAVVSAVLACAATWRELSDVRRAHAVEMLATSRAHGAALREERRHNASVVDVLTMRTARSADASRRLQGELQGLASRVQALTGTIAALRAEIRSLSDQRADALEERQRRIAEIAALSEALRSREAELRELSESAGQVRTMPRRMRAEHDDSESPASVASVQADELWPDGRRLDVAELVQGTVLLPNYEGDRKLA